MDRRRHRRLSRGAGAAAAAAFVLLPGAAAGAGLPAAASMGAVEHVGVATESTLEGALGEPIAAGPPGAGRRPVKVFTYEGSFVGRALPHPAGTPAPSGHRLRQVVDAETGEILLEELGASSPAAAASRVRAHAAWNEVGKGCFKESERFTHCYDVAEWAMGAGEQVKGAELQDETTNMLVPAGGHNEGWDINNEEWALFPQRSNANGPWWFENGIESGRTDEHSLYWFVAWNNGQGYGVLAPGYQEEGWRWINFSMQFNGQHSWCSWIEGNLATCVGGLLEVALVLQVGSEYVTPWTPVDNFNEQTNYTPASEPQARRTWNLVNNFTEVAESQRVPCSRGGGQHPGNYSFYVPSWAHNAGC